MNTHHPAQQRTIQTIGIQNPAPIENPSAWMRSGYSPTEIIIAVAILTSASLWAIAAVIISAAHLIRASQPHPVQPATNHSATSKPKCPKSDQPAAANSQSNQH